MNVLKKQSLVTLAMASMLWILSFPAVGAETFTGRLVGYECAEQGKTCPTDRLDPHIALERDFVLVMPNGKYYFLVNINRDIKLRHVLENVSITGELDKKFDSITVMEFKATQGSKERTIWSQEMEDAEFNRLYNSG